MGIYVDVQGTASSGYGRAATSRQLRHDNNKQLDVRNWVVPRIASNFNAKPNTRGKSII